MVLLCVGAPFHVTRGLLAHGALFLPVLLLVFLLLGTPLMRLALAIGQIHQSIPGRDAVITVQWLVRLLLVGLLLFVAARAAGWIFAGAAHDFPPQTLLYQQRELTEAAAQWHAQPSNAFLAGATSVLGFTLLLALVAGRARVTGLSWLGAPLLGACITLLLLGFAVALTMPGAGALAAVSAPPRAGPLVSLDFWADIGRVTLLATGAQAGVVVAAGSGLPGRAEIGREARVLVCGMAFILVLTGICGLLLLSALCLEQGLIPQARHAAPSLLVLDLVPALGERLFASWPPEWQLPEMGRRVTAAWCFTVALAGSFGACGLLISRSPLPDAWRSRTARYGYAAALVVAAALAMAAWQGSLEILDPLLVVLPALLGLMRLNLARRQGAGLRVAKAAFEARTPALEKLHFSLAFSVARPLLVALVIVVAAQQREGGLVLAASAACFALMWLGSLQAEPVRAATMRLPKAALLLLVAAPALHAASAPPTLQELHARIAVESDDTRRAALRHEFEARLRRGAGQDFDATAARALVSRQLAALGRATGPERAGQAACLQDALATLLLADESPEAQQLEHQALVPSTRDVQRILGALEGARVRDEAGLRSAFKDIGLRLGRGRVARADFDGGQDAAAWAAPLVSDMAEIWGTAGPEARIIRRELVRAAVQGRTLLLPDARAGAVFLACLALASALLTVSLWLARGSARPA